MIVSLPGSQIYQGQESVYQSDKGSQMYKYGLDIINLGSWIRAAGAAVHAYQDEMGDENHGSFDISCSRELQTGAKVSN